MCVSWTVGLKFGRTGIWLGYVNDREPWTCLACEHIAWHVTRCLHLKVTVLSYQRYFDLAYCKYSDLWICPIDMPYPCWMNCFSSSWTWRWDQLKWTSLIDLASMTRQVGRIVVTWTNVLSLYAHLHHHLHIIPPQDTFSPFPQSWSWQICHCSHKHF